MINFEEELKQFQPIPEVDQTEEAIYNNDLKDISDIVAQVAKEIKAASTTNVPTAGRVVRR